MQFFFVKVKTRSKINKIGSIIKINDKDFLEVFIQSAPINGKANEVLIELLAEYFKTVKKNIEIIHGIKSSIKKIIIKT